MRMLEWSEGGRKEERERRNENEFPESPVMDMQNSSLMLFILLPLFIFSFNLNIDLYCGIGPLFTMEIENPVSFNSTIFFHLITPKRMFKTSFFFDTK